MKDNIYIGNTYIVKGKKVTVITFAICPKSADVATVWLRHENGVSVVSGERFMSMNPKMV
jgi:hypothetical protein